MIQPLNVVYAPIVGGEVAVPVYDVGRSLAYYYRILEVAVGPSFPKKESLRCYVDGKFVEDWHQPLLEDARDVRFLEAEPARNRSYARA